MVRRVTSSVFVGHAAERARLEAAFAAAAAGGEAGLVLVGGEAGVGKTRLVTEIEALARGRGAIVLRGNSMDTRHGSLAFAPFVEILDQVQSAAPDAVALLDDVSRNEVARLVPRFGQAPPADDEASDETTLRLYHAIHEAFRLAADERPLLVIVEDIHWANDSTLDLLRFLATRLGSQRVLVLATFRTDELSRSHPLRGFLAEAERLPTVERVEVPHLTLVEVADLITGILERRPPDDVVDRIFDRSDGNPFFVEELVAADLEGALRSRTLQEVLAGRIATLPADSRAIIGVAAVFGREFDYPLLARVADLPDERLLEGLRQGVERHLLVPSDRPGTTTFAFRHGLIQEFAYAELLSPERIALHASIAAALEDARGSPAEIAHHAYLAHDLPTALVRSVEAADDAIAALGFGDALAHLERCLELWRVVEAPERLTDRDQSAVLLLAARCASASGKRVRARDLARLALADLDPVVDRDARAAVLLDLYMLEAVAGNPLGRDDATLEAADLVAATPPTALRARVLLNLAGVREMSGQAEEARQLAEEAIDVARSAGAPDTEAAALVRLADLLGGSFGQAVTAVDLLDRAQKLLAEQPGSSDELLGRVWLLRVWRLLLAGHAREALEVADQAERRAAQAGTLGQHLDGLRETKITALAELGRWTEAEALVEDARRAGAAVYGRAIEGYIPILLRTGRLAEAEKATGALLVRPDVGPSNEVAGIESVIRLAAAERRWHDARTAIDDGIAALPDPIHEAALWFPLAAAIESEADCAEIARRRRRRGEVDEACRIGLDRLDLLRRSAGTAIELGGAGPLAEALLATAEAEAARLRHRPDPPAWDDAATRKEALGQLWDGAYCRYRQAQAVLETKGSRAMAEGHLRAAHGVADQLGALPLLRQIEELARRARMDLATVSRQLRGRAVTREGVSVAMTRREREVLSLVSEGHTNREIGERLFISEKTASVHITNAMNKLGALSRYEAAATAARLGLLGDGTAPSPRCVERRAN